MFVVLSQLVYPADVQDDDPETLGAELPIQGLPSILVKVGLLGDQEDWLAGQLGHSLESFERLPGVLPKDGNGAAETTLAIREKARERLRAVAEAERRGKGR